MDGARGFDDIFNSLAAWVSLGRNTRPRTANLPASTSEMRRGTEFGYGMGDGSVAHSQRSLGASCARRTCAPASVTALRGRTSYAERGAGPGALGSFVERGHPPDPGLVQDRLAPPSRQPGPTLRQPAPMTKMRRFTDAFEPGL